MYTEMIQELFHKGIIYTVVSIYFAFATFGGLILLWKIWRCIKDDGNE